MVLPLIIAAVAMVAAIVLYATMPNAENDALRSFGQNRVGSPAAACPVGGITGRPLCNSAIQVRVTNVPNQAQLDRINNFLFQGQYQAAIDAACAAYGILQSQFPGGRIVYDGTLDHPGHAYPDRVALNPALLTNNTAQALVGSIVHEGTHFRQYDRMPANNRAPETFSQSQTNYAEAMAYDSEVQAARQTGIEPTSSEYHNAVDRRNGNYSGLNSMQQAAFRDGRWPPP